MKVVILAGGLGTRLEGETRTKPKPMVEVAGRPLLWHIMSVYGSQQVTEFVVALGYRGEAIESFFHADAQDAAGAVRVYSEPPERWTIDLVDTGMGTATGGRIKRLARWIGDETFMLTYGDGLADVDVASLLAFHRAHGRLVTVTAVRPPARFGALTLDGDLVREFAEKSQVAEGWINGGYFVLEPEALAHIEGDDTTWEREPLERLAREGELAAFRHEGFWQCVDTPRDLRYLNDLCTSDEVPWRRAPH